MALLIIVLTAQFETLGFIWPEEGVLF